MESYFVAYKLFVIHKYVYIRNYNETTFPGSFKISTYNAISL